MVYHRSVVLLSSSLDNYALPICLNIFFSFNQLTDKVRRNHYSKLHPTILFSNNEVQFIRITIVKISLNNFSNYNTSKH